MPEYWKMAYDAAVRAGIDPNIFVRQMALESQQFDEDVITGKRKGAAGELGIAQIMPQYHPGINPLNPQQALDYAAQLMRSYLDRYGNYELALAAYNAGPGAVQKYGGVPPFEVTQNYIKKILGTVEGAPAHKQTPIPPPGASAPSQGRPLPDKEPVQSPGKSPGGDPSTTLAFPEIVFYEKYDEKSKQWIWTDETPSRGGFLKIGDNDVRETRQRIYKDGHIEESYDGGKTYQFTRFEDNIRKEYLASLPKQGTETAARSIQKIGNKVYLVNELTKEVELLNIPVEDEVEKFQDPHTGAILLYNKTKGRIESDKEGFPIMLSRPIPGWKPGIGVQEPPALRNPEQIELDKLRVRNQDLTNQKLERELGNQFSQALKDADQAISELQAKHVRGEIGLDEMNRTADLIRENTVALLKGTTPFQLEQQKQNQQNIRATLAESYLNRRSQTAATMGQSLLSGLLGAYGKLRTSNNPPPMPDPLAMAWDFTDYTGNDELSQLARSVLTGALGGQQ